MSGFRDRMLKCIEALVANSRRITTSGDWLPEVDGVRLVAIALVLMQHVYERVIRRTIDLYPDGGGNIFKNFVAHGSLGVLIFFTLSGYILARILVGRFSGGKPPNLRSYFMRRLTRLEPPYILVMTGMFLLLSLSGPQADYTHSFKKGAETLHGAWLVSMVYAYCPTFGEMPKLNPPAWSLEIEVQFYFLAPLLAWLITRLHGKARLLSAIACMICWSLFVSSWATDPHVKHTLLRFFPFFFGGFAVLEIERLLGKAEASRREGFRPAFDLMAILAIVALMSDEYWLAPSGRTWVRPLGALIFVSGCLFGGAVRRVLSVPLLAMIGGMCYSIYLVHLPIIEAASNFTVRVGRGFPFVAFLAIQFLLLGPIVLILGWLFFRLVERPCMDRNWPGKLWSFVRGRTWQDPGHHG
jgi:peptidoglycan/LPS O-acetylase OafA/YrhL